MTATYWYSRGCLNAIGLMQKLFYVAGDTHNNLLTIKGCDETFAAPKVCFSGGWTLVLAGWWRLVDLLCIHGAKARNDRQLTDLVTMNTCCTLCATSRTTSLENSSSTAWDISRLFNDLQKVLLYPVRAVCTGLGRICDLIHLTATLIGSSWARSQLP